MPNISHWILLTGDHITETYIWPEGDQWIYEVSPKNMVKKDDVVYLWLNYQDYFYGWGNVAESPRIITTRKTPESDIIKRQRIVVNRKPFDPPITKQMMFQICFSVSLSRSRNLKHHN
jgi:hypothetical protein